MVFLTVPMGFVRRARMGRAACVTWPLPNAVCALVPLVLASCAASPPPSCPALPTTVAAMPTEQPGPEPDTGAALSEQQLTAQRIARACLRGEATACQSIADGRAPQEPGRLASLIEAAKAQEARAVANRDEEASLGRKLLDAPGPERLSAPVHLVRACDLAHAGACNDLGWAWHSGFGTLTKDTKRAAELYELACDLGSELGCLNRGRLARNDDKGKAGRYMALACEKKLEPACVELAGTVAEAEAACKKHASECTNWGFMKEHGYGTTADETQALANYERACAVKEPVGCFNAGIFLRDGRVAKADPAGARRRFDASCKAGHDAGCRQAALLKPSLRSSAR